MMADPNSCSLRTAATRGHRDGRAFILAKACVAVAKCVAFISGANLTKGEAKDLTKASWDAGHLVPYQITHQGSRVPKLLPCALVGS